MFFWREGSMALRASPSHSTASFQSSSSSPLLRGTAPCSRRLWIALLLWAVFLYCLWPDRAQRKLLRADSLRTVSLCALVAVGWSTSAYGYYRHFAYLSPEMTADRAVGSAAAYLASGRPANLERLCFHSDAARGISCP